MLQSLYLINFKSFELLDCDFSRVNIFIGGNGAGKSNLLEAIAIYGAIEDGKNDNISLSARGVRVADSSNFSFGSSDKSGTAIGVCYKNRPANHMIFLEEMDEKTGKINYSFRSGYHDGEILKIFSPVSEDCPEKDAILEESADDEESSEGVFSSRFLSFEKALEEINSGYKIISDFSAEENKKVVTGNVKDIATKTDALLYSVAHNIRDVNIKKKIRGIIELKDFVLYSPEISSLRSFDSEGSVLPLGSNGEGLLRYLKKIIDERRAESNNDMDFVDDILGLVGCFNWVEVDENELGCIEIDVIDRKMSVRDRYMNGDLDFRYTNEGFLFVLFYATLFCSPDTPKIFAVDNIDIALNPLMCKVLIKKLIGMAKKYDKQVFLTTHNPAILDGINIGDPDQALFVVKRNDSGYTVVDKIDDSSFPKDFFKKNDINRLSEAFIRGQIVDALQDF